MFIKDRLHKINLFRLTYPKMLVFWLFGLVLSALISYVIGIYAALFMLDGMILLSTVLDIPYFLRGIIADGIIYIGLPATILMTFLTLGYYIFVGFMKYWIWQGKVTQKLISYIDMWLWKKTGKDAPLTTFITKHQRLILVGMLGMLTIRITFGNWEQWESIVNGINEMIQGKIEDTIQISI